MFRNRIVGTGEESPEQLMASPWNGWKIHPVEQQDEVEKVLETVGWVKRVTVNKRTGHVVDGHLRVLLAIRRNEEAVPVEYIDVDEREERLLIATLDPLASMSGRDNDQLVMLVSDIRTDFPDSDIDLEAILKADRQVTQGLAHDVRACTCCETKCKPGCGCHRDAKPERKRK